MELTALVLDPPLFLQLLDKQLPFLLTLLVLEEAVVVILRHKMASTVVVQGILVMVDFLQVAVLVLMVLQALAHLVVALV